MLTGDVKMTSKMADLDRFWPKIAYFAALSHIYGLFWCCIHALTPSKCERRCIGNIFEIQTWPYVDG